MFAKGPAPGGVKQDALKLAPRAVCYRKTSYSVQGYIVDEYPGGPQLGAGPTAHVAWQNAYVRLLGRSQ